MATSPSFRLSHVTMQKNAMMRGSWQLPFKCLQTKHVLYAFGFNFYTCFRNISKWSRGDCEMVVFANKYNCIIDCEAKCAKEQIEKMILVKKGRNLTSLSLCYPTTCLLSFVCQLVFFYPLQRGISLDTSSIQLSGLMFSEIHHFTHGALGSQSRCVWE